MNQRKFIRNTSLAASGLGLAPAMSWTADAKQKSKSTTPIDRHALVTRHNVELGKVDARSALQVGNGNFAFTADVTGLQTFYGFTLSTWGWHEEPLPSGMKPEDRNRTEFITHGRKRYYLAPNNQPDLARWLKDNPHRANLGRLRFMTDATGQTAINSEAVTNIHQKLDLWTGLLVSDFEMLGKPVHVETVCDSDQDTVAIRITSPLLSEGKLSVGLDFSYPVPSGNNWNSPDRHTTLLERTGSNTCRFDRQADTMKYSVNMAWSAGASLREVALKNHAYCLAVDGKDTLVFVCNFSSNATLVPLPSFEETQAASANMWQIYWNSGGAIDLSASKDPRWFELERRIVLSQYLMRVNSAGSMPPPEIGLFGIDPWRSKFHLEMTAWHGAHFMLWNRPDCVKGWINWFNTIGLPAAEREAQAEGWKGAKWLKTPDPFGRWESWDLGPNRVTQNAQMFYWAELCYRDHPTRETLETWKDIVFETATMMADFVAWDEQTGRYILGPPVMSGAEGGSGFDSWNSTSELNYWAMSLQIAQAWRERLGLPREPKWDQVLQHLSRPPVKDGVYIDAESQPEIWDQTSSGRFLRPAWFEVYGCIRGPMIDPAIMEKTYDRASQEMRLGKWKGNLWGCDYPMMAMTAARLGKTKEAVDWLLYPTPLNEYTPNGFCAGWYLPGNGGLLWAVAMMTAGWDGAPQRNAPGFPDDGSWTVKWERLKSAP